MSEVLRDNWLANLASGMRTRHQSESIKNIVEALVSHIRELEKELEDPGESSLKESKFPDHKKLYASRDIISQGLHYTNHTFAMTTEGLHWKPDIAAELAHRDMVIEELQWILRQIIRDLPSNLDWLDPEIEAAARNEMGEEIL